MQVVCQHTLPPVSSNARLCSYTSAGRFACGCRPRLPKSLLSIKRGFLMASTIAQPDRIAANASPTDAAEGGLSQFLGNLCFRSRYSTYLWNTSISAPYRVVRLAAMTLIALLLLARSWRLFIRSASDADNLSAEASNCLHTWQFVSLILRNISSGRSPLDGAILFAVLVLASWQFGLFTAAAIVAFALILTLAKQLASTPEVNAGHRAGGKGFAGKLHITFSVFPQGWKHWADCPWPCSAHPACHKVASSCANHQALTRGKSLGHSHCVFVSLYTVALQGSTLRTRWRP